MHYDRLDIKGKKILVVGLARSGIASALFARKKGALVTVTDISSPENLDAPVSDLEKQGIRLILGRHVEDDFTQADLVILSPGVPHTITPVKQAVSKGVKVVGEMEFASWFIKAPIVAVTGTNGKTTVTTLLGKMLSLSEKSVFVGGNIGAPLTGYVDTGKTANVVVAEVSSFQLDTIDTFVPEVAVLLNISEDHMDRYPDFEGYGKSKFRIFENQTRQHTAILNSNDPVIAKMLEATPLNGRIWRYFENEKHPRVVVEKGCLKITVDRKKPFQIDLTKTGIKGPHNIENIAAASLGAIAAGGTQKGIQAAVDAFTGLPHRMETVKTLGGVLFINDSKATNVVAVEKALESFDRPIHLIMGGQHKGGIFTPLEKEIRTRVKTLICMGEAGDEIFSTLKGAPIVKAEKAADMDMAVAKAFANAEKGDVVLLSPACASFDMFENYEARGRAFIKAVDDLT